MWYEWEAVLSWEQSSGEPDRCRQRILRQRAEFVIKDNCATSCAPRCSARPSRSQATLSQTVCTYNHESSCPSFVWSPCQFSGGGCRYPLHSHPFINVGKQSAGTAMDGEQRRVGHASPHLLYVLHAQSNKGPATPSLRTTKTTAQRHILNHQQTNRDTLKQPTNNTTTSVCVLQSYRHFDKTQAASSLCVLFSHVYDSVTRLILTGTPDSQI